MDKTERSHAFLSLKNYRAGSLLFGAAVIPTFIIGNGLRLLFGRGANRPLGVFLLAAGIPILILMLHRFGSLLAEREWGVAAPPRLALSLFWRLALFDLVFWIGNGSFPYARVRDDFFIGLLFLINLLLLIHLVPTAHGFALRDLLSRSGRVSPPSLPFDLVLFGILLVMEGPIDFSIMVRNPEYSLALFGRVIPGEAGVVFTWSWPFVHILLGYAVLARRRWVFYALIAGGVYALISAGFNYYAYGFGVIRTIFVSILPLLMAYLWRRRRYFLDGEKG